MNLFTLCFHGGNEEMNELVRQAVGPSHLCRSLLPAVAALGV